MAEDSALAGISSQEAWEAFNAELPDLLDQLVTAKPSNADAPPTSLDRGIYLFSDEAEESLRRAHWRDRPLADTWETAQHELRGPLESAH